MKSPSSLRIVLCTKQDIAGAIILNRILPQLAGHRVMVLLSNKTRDAEVHIPQLVTLKYLERDLPVGTVFPLLDALGKSGKKLTFQALAAKYQFPLHVVDDVNSAHWMRTIGDFAPDIMASVRFSNIFKPAVIALPRLGTFNIHPGALPHYAGLFPSFRALLNDERQIGCSLHRVDASIDGGPLLGIGWTDTDPARGLLWHVFKSYNAGLDMFVDYLPRLVSGVDINEMPQDKSLRHYRSMPSQADIQRFVDRGLQWFDAGEYAESLSEFLPDGIPFGFGVPPCA